MQGEALANRSKSRRELDFYPTPPEVTLALMNFLHQTEILQPGREIVWEPACGDGAMAEVINASGHHVYASDIRHTGYGMGGTDYLLTKATANATIITNPPFNQSEQFIRKALEQDEAYCVAFLLKSQYWHAAKRTKLFHLYPPFYVLPLNWRPDFMGGERGGAPTMECLWTVWMQGQTDTRYRILERP